MYCSRCPHNGKYTKNDDWNSTACSRCQLRQDSYGTMPYSEGRSENSIYDPENDFEDSGDNGGIADNQTPAPYALLDGDPDDPLVPLSVLVDAMQLWMRLSLPARKTFQLRMSHVPYSEIGKRLGCTRQAVEKLVAKAIAKDPVLGCLLPEKKGRGDIPLSATRTPVIAEHDSVCKKVKKNAPTDSLCAL